MFQCRQCKQTYWDDNLAVMQLSEDNTVVCKNCVTQKIKENAPMQCGLCKKTMIKPDMAIAVHKECLETPLQAYGIFADIQKHYEFNDLQAAVHVLPIDTGQYYKREDVDRLLGRIAK